MLFDDGDDEHDDNLAFSDAAMYVSRDISMAWVIFKSFDYLFILLTYKSNFSCKKMQNCSPT